MGVGDGDLDLRAFPGAGVYRSGASEQRRALFDPEQPPGLPLTRTDRPGVEAPAVVADLQVERLVSEADPDAHRGGPGAANDVGQGFLGDAKERGIDCAREGAGISEDLDGDLEGRPSLHFAGVPA